jgi:hypothetical protein
VVSFLQVSPPKPCISLSSSPYVLHYQRVYDEIKLEEKKNKEIKSV